MQILNKKIRSYENLLRMAAINSTPKKRDPDIENAIDEVVSDICCITGELRTFELQHLLPSFISDTLVDNGILHWQRGKHQLPEVECNEKERRIELYISDATARIAKLYSLNKENY